MSSTISVSEYDALYDGFCRVRAERDAAIARADRLRDALVQACNATDGFASPEVSDEFLLSVPDEVAKCIGRLRARAVAAEDRARWNIERDEMGDVLVCYGDHDKSEKCQTERWVPRSRAEAAEAQVERLEDALTRIAQWADAYPLDVFPEPNLVQARALLEAGGMTLDSISASAMRYCLNGTGRIARAALAGKEPADG